EVDGESGERPPADAADQSTVCARGLGEGLHAPESTSGERPQPAQEIALLRAQLSAFCAIDPQHELGRSATKRLHVAQERCYKKSNQEVAHEHRSYREENRPAG